MSHYRTFREEGSRDRRFAMKTLPQKCVDIDSVGSFCDCIAVEDTSDSAAQEFCSQAKTDKNITSKDLAELKISLMDQDDEACCDC